MILPVNNLAKSRGPDVIASGRDGLVTAASTISPVTTAALLPGVVAVLAIHGTVAARLKRNRGLLPAPGASDRRALRFAPAVSSASALFVLLCLAACLAALRSRIATLLKKRLIVA